MTDALTYRRGGQRQHRSAYRPESIHSSRHASGESGEVRVLAADGVTPVSGATIGWSATTACNFRRAAERHRARSSAIKAAMPLTWLTPAATGVATVTATLAPGVYSSSKSVSATLNATSHPLTLESCRPIFGLLRAPPPVFR